MDRSPIPLYPEVGNSQVYSAIPTLLIGSKHNFFVPWVEFHRWRVSQMEAWGWSLANEKKNDDYIDKNPTNVENSRKTESTEESTQLTASRSNGEEWLVVATDEGERAGSS